MLTRSVKARLLIFVVGSVLLMAYAGVKYAGFGWALHSRGCTIGVDLTDSGGVFTGGEVDYRGVAIGRISSLEPRSDGVRVNMQLTSCSSPPIPASVTATVADQSAIGEQYIDLSASSTARPYLKDGDTIPVTQTRLPLPVQVLLANLNGLASSVNPNELNTVVSGFGIAFQGQTVNLRSLLDSGAALLAQTQRNLPQTLNLVDNLNPVAHVLLNTATEFTSWASSLKLVAAQLRSDDPSIRALLAVAPPALSAVDSFARSISSPLGTLLANLSSGGQIMQAHLGGLNHILALYPRLVAAGPRLVRAGAVQLGVVVDWNEPPTCVYSGVTRRLPTSTTPAVPAGTARSCASPVRGAANAPSTASTASTGASESTESTEAAGSAGDVMIDTSSAQSRRLLSDDSWLTLLTQPLADSKGAS